MITHQAGRNPVLIIASQEELPAVERVWGTGGWYPPEQREALDWLTLVRLLGWSADVVTFTNARTDASLLQGRGWIIIACDTEMLQHDFVGQLSSALERDPVLVIARAAQEESPFAKLAGTAGGQQRLGKGTLQWNGPGEQRRWDWREPIPYTPLISESARSWSVLDDQTVLTAQTVGRGLVAILGFHPGLIRDTNKSGTALLKRLLVDGAPFPVAWFDLENTLVLRMDDPGGAQNVHSRNWTYAKLPEADWLRLGSDLKRRQARLSVAYTVGWMDDGDTARGTLEIEGLPAERVAGRVHPSPLVQYRDVAGNSPGTIHDYTSEFRGIQALLAAGLGDVELHGRTHMYPGGEQWATAPDRYDENRWFRELGEFASSAIARRPPDEHPLNLAMTELSGFFPRTPTTLISPGDQWTNAALERALKLGLQLVDSYYLAIRDDERFCWSIHVCSPYLDEPDPAWFEAELPVIGYFHDRDPVVHGIEWVASCLDRWIESGANRIIDFRELASTVGRRIAITGSHSSPSLRVDRCGAPDIVREIPIRMRFPDGVIPQTITVIEDAEIHEMPVEDIGNGYGRIRLTAG